MEKIEKVLQLYYKDGGINDAPFPSSEDQIEIGAFRYNATRMGGAPTITATVMYPICLDDVWTDSVYAKFNGEKYYLKQTPTSSYDNEDSRYKHSIELVSERSILDDVYFFDVVTDNPQVEDKPVSNSSKVTFFGNVYEFVKRLNASLKYSKVNYTVVVDESDEIPTEDKLVSFEDQFFSNVLQEIYNTYEVPYYFDGRTIHIGYSKGDVVIPDLEYGIDNALLSITKTNANHKIVNRVTGIGSSDNIPFYYPNNSPKGEIEAIESDGSQLGVEIIDSEAFSNKVELNGVITYTAQEATVTRVTDTMGNSVSSGANSITTKFTYKGFSTKYEMRITSYANGSIPLTISPILNFYKYKDSDDTVGERATGKTQIKIFRKGELIAKSDDFILSKTFDIELPQGSSVLSVHVIFNPEYDSSTNWFDGSAGLSWATDSKEGWYYKNKEVELKDLGLSISNNAPQSGSTITQKLVKYINTSPNLMPSVYRTTDGKERFYNAIDKIYDGWEFNNPYVEGKPKEHIIKVDDIKPTIEGVVNSTGLRMDMFSEFAYDDDDNDETLPEEDGSDRKFLHSYFFGKLRKLDFNLFDHAIEQQPMTVSFTSGDCGACNFEIGVSDEFPNKNPVLVNADGTLKRDSNGRVICGQFQKIKESELQDRQQDTINNEVWIALKKEEETYGILMPKAPKFNENGEQIEAGHRPKAAKDEDGTPNNDGDTFVILGIHLPKSYIINAEKKLEAEIIKYLKENNDEKFTFSINFSRIYFAENQDILRSLNENSKVRVIYDNIPYDLYVSSFSYSISEGDILPDIKVELDDTLKVSSNAIRNAINEVKSSLGNNINEIANAVAMQTRSFVSKIEDDNAKGVVNFSKGITFENGGRVDILDNNSAKLTIDYIEVTKKATFTSLEIQEKTHAGGQILVTPAAIKCNNVEELDDCYRCYFQTEGEGGDEIFNQFVVEDQAICQTFNVWESKYYWRLVTGIGENYIDLSKEDCDEGSDIPSVGDKIIQLGHRSDETRQNAIVIAAYGDGSPYIIQYKGINSFELPEDKIATKLSSTENIFTGIVHIKEGSDGFGELGDFSEIINESIQGIEVGGQNMLRNSGFTGDYLSAQLADQTVLDAAGEMFNPPLVHWDTTGTVEVVDLTGISVSGKGVEIGYGKISQETYNRAIYSETYVVSFKAKSESEGSSLDVRFGGVTTKKDITTDWDKYLVLINANTPINEFYIESTGVVTICDLQLERGTIASSWGNSFLDNQSDRAYYQAGVYVQQALHEGSTTIGGGLVLTNHVKVGQYANKEMIQETGGMQGSWTNDNDVFIWGGGSLEEAENAVEEKGDDEANFVVTHGGKAILNDAVVRGTVYAKDGSFEGEIKASKGNFGDLHIVSSERWGDAGLEGTKVYDETEAHNLKLYPDYFGMEAFDNGELRDSIKISPYWYGDRYDMDGIVQIFSTAEKAAINIEGGFVRGLRMPIVSTSDDVVDLYGYFPNIVILSSQTNNLKSVYLPTRATKGDTIHIINSHRSALIVGMEDNTKKIVFNTEEGTTDYAGSWNDGANNPYKVEAYFDGSMWYLCPIR
jgi:hypothetical protein